MYIEMYNLYTFISTKLCIVYRNIGWAELKNILKKYKKKVDFFSRQKILVCEFSSKINLFICLKCVLYIVQYSQSTTLVQYNSIISLFLFLLVILEKTIRIPRSLSVKANSILKGFLNKNPADRLGCNRESGFAEIMSHQFFRNYIDWELVSKPNTNTDISVSLFFQDFHAEQKQTSDAVTIVFRSLHTITIQF